MIRLYSRLSDHDTILELWSASTKHPDSIFYFSDFKKTEFFEPEDQIFQWLLECASRLIFPVHAYDLAQFAIEYYNQGRG